MKARSRSIIILSILFGYILLQFLWWEVLLVRQNGQIINEKQKLAELASTNGEQLKRDVDALHYKKKMQTIMIVGEGTVFLLLLLFGIYKIKQAMDKETSLNNQQKNFFLSITHELKTPIAATKLQLQTLRKQRLPEEMQQQLISNALLETERLNGLIDNILLASRLEGKEFIFNKQKTDLSVMVSEIINRYYKSEVSSKIITCQLEPVQAEVDHQFFPSVIINLVDNALKYSSEEKQILIQLEKKKRNWYFDCQ